MPNKFKKSVMERLEQEAVIQKQKKKSEKKVKEPEQLLPEKMAEENREPEIIDTEIKNINDNAIKKDGSATVPPISDIGDYIIKETPRLAKNKTFYLDAEVIETIKSTAKAQNVTDSKLVNDILRRVLGL